MTELERDSQGQILAYRDPIPDTGEDWFCLGSKQKFLHKASIPHHPATIKPISPLERIRAQEMQIISVLVFAKKCKLWEILPANQEFFVANELHLVIVLM